MDVSSALASPRRRRLLVPPAILALAVSMGPGSADPSPAERSHRVNAVVGNAANAAAAVTIPDGASVAEGGDVADGRNHPQGSDSSGPGSSGADTRTWFVAPSGDNSAAGTRSAPIRTVQAAVDRASKGDAIVLRGGVYHESVSINKNALTLRAAQGETVWFDGSSAVGGFVREGSVWVRHGWDIQFDHSPTFHWGAPDGSKPGWGFVNPKYPMAAWPDQVWVDGSPLAQVADAASVREGTFAVDYASHRLIIGTDPAGHRVRASTLAKAMSVRGSDTRMQGFGIRRYAPSVPHTGAVTLERPRISVRDVTITQTATSGLNATADDITLVRVRATGNGLIGIKATSAYGLRIVRSRSIGNNTEHFNQAPVSGGIKITKSRNVRLMNNVIRDNNGTGLWLDESTYNDVVVGNRVIGNTGHGIFLEISDTAVVANNLVMRNEDTGIQVDNTGHVQVWNNTVVGNGRPLNIVQDRRVGTDRKIPGHNRRRPLPDPTVPWIAQSVTVVNNVLERPLPSANCLLCVEDFTHKRSAAQMHVVADGNVYGRRDDGSPRWLVVWSSGAGSPEVFTTLEEFRRRTGLELKGRLAADPLVDSVGHATGLLAKLHGTSSRPLPDAVGQLVGQPSGTKHLGVFFGQK
jgi:parallel beta-helix repeat protein